MAKAKKVPIQYRQIAISMTLPMAEGESPPKPGESVIKKHALKRIMKTVMESGLFDDDHLKGMQIPTKKKKRPEEEEEEEEE